jgi:hypothetical protein
MRHFNDGDEVVHRAVAREGLSHHADLVVDRSAFDRIIAAGGFVSVNTAVPRRERPARAKDVTPTRDGRGGLHRLWRLRGGLQERLGDAVRLGEGRTWPTCRRASPSGTSG